MSRCTLADFIQMTPSEKKAIHKPDLLKLLDSFTNQTQNIPTDTLKDIVTECMEKVISERLPDDLVSTIQEVKDLRTELDTKTEEIRLLKKVIGEHQRVLENVSKEHKANNVFITGEPCNMQGPVDRGMLQESKEIIQYIFSSL